MAVESADKTQKMKKHITRFSLILLAGIMLMTGATQTAKAQEVMVSYQTFYDNLSPYGQWVYDPQYGNVWVPNEDGDFRPYGSRGYWAMTEYGNTWISDDPWGWAVYHYGRWTYNPYYGWVWVPGYEWAPAWVSWRFGGGYAGWAPMGPGINAGTSYYAPDTWWVFVSPNYMYQPNCIRYWNGPSYNTTYIRQTTIINNYYVDNSTRVRYNYGPRAEAVQQVTNRPVQVYRVNQLNRPGAPSVGRGSVSMYRPTVNRGTVNDARPQRVMQAPQSVGRGQQVQQMSGRQPAFRQEAQRFQQQEGGRGNDNRGNVNQNDNRGNDNRGGREQQQTQTQQTDRGSRGGERNEQEDARTRMQPGRYDSRMDRTQQDQQQGRDQQAQQQRDQQARDQRAQQTRDQQAQQQRDQQVRDQRAQQARDQQAQQQRDQQVRDQQAQQRAQQTRDQQAQQQRDQQARDQQAQQQRDQQQRQPQMREPRAPQAPQPQQQQPQQPQQPQQQGGRGGRR